MSNHFKLPLAMPFKMVPLSNTGFHFDDKLYSKQIRSFEKKVLYEQKWIKGNSTTIQCESTIAPDNMLVMNKYGLVVKSFVWNSVVSAVNYQIYQLTFNVDDVDNGTYFLYQKVELLGIKWEFISEPISIGDYFPNLIRFRYRNSINKDDVAWTTGLECMFMCEADIQDFEPDAEETDYINEVHDTTTQFVTPYRNFQLYIGDTRDAKSGVAPYMIDILNRVFACDTTFIEDKQYENKSGSKIKVTRTRGYPLIGGSLDLVEAKNLQSLEMAEDTDLGDVIVTAYNIETGFFGPAAIIPVTEVEQNG